MPLLHQALHPSSRVSPEAPAVEAEVPGAVVEVEEAVQVEVTVPQSKVPPRSKATLKI